MEETMTEQMDFQQFEEIRQIIERHRTKALREVNYELVLSAWEVGGYISQRLKNAAWGSQSVKQLSEYLRKENPTLRGYSRRHLYNMVEFYDSYYSPEFEALMQRWPQLAALHENKEQPMQSVIAQMQVKEKGVKPIVQSVIAQLKAIPQFLLIIPFTNHIIIMNNCKGMDMRIFYILYSYREHLTTRTLQRAITADAMGSLLGARSVQPW